MHTIAQALLMVSGTKALPEPTTFSLNLAGISSATDPTAGSTPVPISGQTGFDLYAGTDTNPVKMWTKAQLESGSWLASFPTNPESITTGSIGNFTVYDDPTGENGEITFRPDTPWEPVPGSGVRITVDLSGLVFGGVLLRKIYSSSGTLLATLMGLTGDGSFNTALNQNYGIYDSFGYMSLSMQSSVGYFMLASFSFTLEYE